MAKIAYIELEECSNYRKIIVRQQAMIAEQNAMISDRNKTIAALAVKQHIK